jgi:hypothetical protein
MELCIGDYFGAYHSKSNQWSNIYGSSESSETEDISPHKYVTEKIYFTCFQQGTEYRYEQNHLMDWQRGLKYKLKSRACLDRLTKVTESKY